VFIKTTKIHNLPIHFTVIFYKKMLVEMVQRAFSHD